MAFQWHAKNTDEVLHTLNTTVKGLSNDEVQRRLKEYGPNELKEAKRVKERNGSITHTFQL
ncbi:MAG: cation-transporting P-type ATPase [Candidatus Bathyarchaeia archaeon]